MGDLHRGSLEADSHHPPAASGGSAQTGPSFGPTAPATLPSPQGRPPVGSCPCSAVAAGTEEAQLTPPSLSGPLFPADTQGWMEDVKQFSPQLAHIVRVTPPPSRESRGEVKKSLNEVEMQHPAPEGRAVRGGTEEQREAATHALRSPFCDSHGEADPRGNSCPELSKTLSAGNI